MKTRYSVSPFAVSFALFFVLGTAGFACAETVDRSILASFYCDRAESFPGYVCKRNVLLIIADDVGVDQVPWYINYYKTNANSSDDINAISFPVFNPATIMPTVDRLAAAGVTFLNAWSSPVCSPTRACLFTGTHSYRHGIFNQLGSSDPGLTPGTPTIATALNAAGYSNALFGKWHLGEAAAYIPTQFGWDHHAGALGGGLTNYYAWEKVVNGDSTTTFVTNSYATTNNVEDALAWIGDQTTPWMATVAFNAPHWAMTNSVAYYQDPPSGCEYKSRLINTDKAKYRAMLECLDRSMTNLLTRMDPTVLANTTIIFMGDNGTEKDITDHFTVNNFPSYGAKNHAKASLYEGGINVPLIIADGYTFLYGQESPWTKGAGRVISPGRVETNIVETLDIFATAAEIGRGDGTSGLDSVSLLPYLKSASASPQRDTISTGTRDAAWTAFGNLGWDVAVRGACYKIIIRDYLSGSETYELYNLSTDRWESNDLWDASLTLSEAFALLNGCP